MLMKGGLLLLVCTLVSTNAFAHRNAGTYRLLKGDRVKGIRAGDVRMPACDPDEPIPDVLEIKYTGPDAPIVLVNNEEWRRGGLTMDSTYRVSDRPFRVATKTNPSPGTWVDVWFRRDGDNASGQVMILRLDPKTGQPSCATAFRFKGRYTP